MNPLLSIIVPCFNNELFIEQCINSVAHQVDQTIELIIINDGSTDQSEKLIKKIIQKYSNVNIKYIAQKNFGAGHARNQGLKLANGTYIGFLDSDDIWLDNTWETLEPILKKQIYDLVEFDAYRFHNSVDINRSQGFNHSYFSKIKHSNHKEKLELVFSHSIWHSSLRIYNKKILKNAHFLKSCRLSEDIPFTVQAYLNTKNIYSLDKALIGYRINPESITNTPKKSNLYDLKNVINTLLILSEKENDESKKLLVYLTSLKVWVSLRNYNFHYKDDSISSFLKSTKKELNKYSFKSVLSKKYLFFYKFDLVALIHFHLKRYK